MNKNKTEIALNDLVMRLKDAEEGYLKIANITRHDTLRKWMIKYANERRVMRDTLIQFISPKQKEIDIPTSFLGDLHRMFIDFKLNHFADNFESIVTEIQRGGQVLLGDYKKILDELSLDKQLFKVIDNQRVLVELELNDLNKLKEEFTMVEA